MLGTWIAPRWWASAGRWSLVLVALAAVGASLLVVVAVTAWPVPSDEAAYWAAAERLLHGDRLYDPTAVPNTPYAYWYPPVLAQVLAPLTLVVPQALFTILWTALLLGCIWVLSGRTLLIALACIAFLPVALELRVRNVHLLIALFMVLGLRRSWLFWVPATAIKLAPALGLLYLIAAGRRREAVLAGVVGLVVAGLSIVASPGAWSDFLTVAGGRAASDAGTFVAVPYVVRLGAGVMLALLSGRFGGRWGEVGLIVAVTIASPTLWGNALSQLLAILPLVPRFGVRADARGGSAG